MAGPALAFRVKSGWAVAALVGGSRRAPVLLGVDRVVLSDPDVPETVQPYHAGFGRAQQDQRVVAALVRRVERCAMRNIAKLLTGHERAGHAPRRTAVVGTSAIDPSTIANEHIRIHALEGQLFRRVVEEALRQHGLECTTMLERDLYGNAPRTLGVGDAALRRRLTELGRDQRGSWRAEQKSAALAAWVLLSSRMTTRESTARRP